MLRLLLLAGVLAAGGWTGLHEYERRMVYRFDTTRVPPERAGLPNVAERRIRSGGETLLAWVAPPAEGRPVILYFHGNAGNLASRADRFARFLERGYGLVAPAYRGSSGSTGIPSETAIAADARAIYDSLARLVPGLSPRGLVLYGESLGSGVALKLVAERAAAQPRAVVLEAPFTSIPAVARRAFPALAPLTPLMRNRWNSRRHVRALAAPLLVLHGTADEVIPVEMGRRIHAAAGSRVRRLVEVPGAGHGGVWSGPALPALWRFIEAQAVSIR